MCVKLCSLTIYGISMNKIFWWGSGKDAEGGSGAKRGQALRGRKSRVAAKRSGPHGRPG